ncbi:WecB/TagA/CpsF family glycosyltransferase [Flammeovirga sp. SubArs3]|uniref:WecB/TagA/CpsF family glycosyltransferase n=1 Tax=Flammeovirga sp. SubArs3 TaxID=2995316 RepID=UPI00248C0CFA|nr:WecB/TagA/CpsF family glycosyltransferase [Flammeovirga sp. SubArs3]
MFFSYLFVISCLAFLILLATVEIRKRYFRAEAIAALDNFASNTLFIAPTPESISDKREQVSSSSKSNPDEYNNYAYINDVKTYAFESRDQLLEIIDKEKKMLVAINAHKILNATDQTRDIINNNIGYADGVGAVMALKQKGLNSIKIPGCEIWLDLIAKYETSKTFYFVGGKDEVINKVIEQLKEDYPQINIVGYRNGYLKEGDEERLLADIEEKKPDVVFVAQGSPRQELLMMKMQEVHKAIYQGLGGSFDVYTGTVERAPEIWVNMKMEWLYRWIKEPQLRTRRNLELFKFFGYLALFIF